MCNKGKRFLDCCRDLNIISVHGNDVDVYSLNYDSRKVTQGSLFFAFSGLHSDGTDFIDGAIKNGAVAIIHEKELDQYSDGVCYVLVENARKAMAPVSAFFYDYPSTKMKVIGVTGTEGKSSTVAFVWQVLQLLGKTAGYFSTVSYAHGKNEYANPEHQTTPEAITVQWRLSEMVKAGCEYAVVESSSHGLSPLTGRLDWVDFDAGIFINVTQEHLEFHGSFEQYRKDKANLFRALEKNDHLKADCKVPSFGVVNLEDRSAQYFCEVTEKDVFGFSTNGVDLFKGITAKNFVGGLLAQSIVETSAGLEFEVVKVSGDMVQKNIGSAFLPLAGQFNVQNILATLLGVSNISGVDLEKILPLLSQIKPITGRMRMVNVGQPFQVLIDYAHTPSSFETIFPPIYKRLQKSKNKIIAVFGSGGERDLQKRPEQGRIASKYCDCIVLTDEDPRGEDSVELLEMIASGCPEKKRDKELFIIPNRPEAIRKAFSLAKSGDAVLLLGKGHENSIIFKDHAMPYDEESEAIKALKDGGYGC